jgi:chromate transporter
LDGVTAGVVGLIVVTAIGLFREAVFDIPTIIIFALALLAVYRWKAKAAVVGIMFGAGMLGWLLFGG